MCVNLQIRLRVCSTLVVLCYESQVGRQGDASTRVMGVYDLASRGMRVGE